MTCIIVLGCFRTGTSAVAGFLHHLGVSMGTSFDAPASSNPKGYFEDLSLKSLHAYFDDEQLLCQKLREYTHARQADLWGVKDPMMCIYLDQFVRCLYDEPKIVNMHRSSRSICESLHKAVSTYESPEQVAPLVNFYLTSKERNLSLISDDIPVLDVAFDELSQSLQAIAEFVDLPLTQQAKEFIK